MHSLKTKLALLVLLTPAAVLGLALTVVGRALAAHLDDHELSSVLQETAGTLTAVTLASALLAYALLSWLVVRPILAIRAALLRRAGGDATARSPVLTGDEIGGLARALNDAFEAHEQSKERIRAIVDSAPDGILTYSDQGVILSFNQAATRIFGYPTAEVLGRPVDLLLPVPGHAGALQGLATGEAKILDLENAVQGRRKDGSLFPLELAISKTLVGQTRTFTAIVKDVTQRQEAAEALRRQALTFENIAEGVVLTDPDGRIVDWNPAAEKLFGYARAEALGQSLGLLHPDNDGALTPRVPELICQGRWTSELRFRRKDGSEGTCAVVVVPLREEQPRRPTTFRFYQDVTERKRYEQELARARDAAEAASRAKSEFLSRMSHELRTPLNAILGFAQLLEMDTLTPPQRESVEHINRGGKHLLGLINEVLDIARIEAGRMELSPEPTRLADLVVEVLELVRPLGSRRNLDFQVDLGAADRCWVLADNQKLRQVLLNLLSNAVKYNRDRGTVTVMAEEAAGRVGITVSDTGIGIAPAFQGRLFTPFDRLGAERSGVEGSGLGLVLSKRLVEAMGGTLSVTSAVGQGSRFRIELAAVRAPRPRPTEMGEQLRPAQPDAGHHTVLLVEDNLANLQLIERALAHRPGVRLLTAMQGSLALELAQQHRPDLILVDLHLPDLHGVEVLRRLQANPATAAIPVLVTSADATARQVERLRRAGARAYLTKPIDVPRFLDLVDELLHPGDAGA